MEKRSWNDKDDEKHFDAAKKKSHEPVQIPTHNNTLDEEVAEKKSNTCSACLLENCFFVVFVCIVCLILSFYFVLYITEEKLEVVVEEECSKFEELEEPTLPIDASATYLAQYGEPSKPEGWAKYLFLRWIDVWKNVLYYTFIVYIITFFRDTWLRLKRIASGHGGHEVKKAEDAFSHSCSRFGKLEVFYSTNHGYSEFIAFLLKLECYAFDIECILRRFTDMSARDVLASNSTSMLPGVSLLLPQSDKSKKQQPPIAKSRRRNLVFVFPDVFEIPYDAQEFFDTVDDFVDFQNLQDAAEIRFAIFATTKFEKHSRRLYDKLTGVGATYLDYAGKMDPLQDFGSRRFRNATKNFWNSALKGITRENLNFRMKLFNPVFHQPEEDDLFQMKRELKIKKTSLKSPYRDEDYITGELVHRNPIITSFGVMKGWEFGVRFKTDEEFKIGQEVFFLYSNSDDDVESICFGLKIDPHQIIPIRMTKGKIPDEEESKDLHFEILCQRTTSAYDALKFYYDIHAPLSHIMILSCAHSATSHHESLSLIELANEFLLGKSSYESLPDLQKDFKSLQMKLTTLLTLLPRIHYLPLNIHNTREVIPDGQKDSEVYMTFIFHSERDSAEGWMKDIEKAEENGRISIFTRKKIVNGAFNILPSFGDNCPLIIICSNAGVPFVHSYIDNFDVELCWCVFVVNDANWQETYTTEMATAFQDRRIPSVSFYNGDLGMKGLQNLLQEQEKVTEAMIKEKNAKIIAIIEKRDQEECKKIVSDHFKKGIDAGLEYHEIFVQEIYQQQKQLDQRSQAGFSPVSILKTAPDSLTDLEL